MLTVKMVNLAVGVVGIHLNTMVRIPTVTLYSPPITKYFNVNNVDF